MNDGRELLILGLVMLFLFVLGVGATVIFIRQWKRERRPKN
jgi:hypothetical protein